MAKKQSYYYFTWGLIMPLIVSICTVWLGRDVPNNLWGLTEKLDYVYIGGIGGVILIGLFIFIEKVIIKSSDYKELDQGTLAIMLGCIVFIFSYLIERFLIKSENNYKKAILLGLLSAEVMVFTKEDTDTFSMATITLLLFFYFHSVEHYK
jgi:hypothetical protein